METGCRPNEAAYLVLNKSFHKTSVLDDCDYIAAVPPQYSKTREWYLWGVKKKMTYVIELVKALHERAPTLSHLRDQYVLAKRLYDWFTRRILKEAAAKEQIVKTELDK